MVTYLCAVALWMFWCYRTTLYWSTEWRALTCSPSHFCKSAPETVILGYLIIVPVCIVTMDAQLQSYDDLSAGENT